MSGGTAGVHRTAPASFRSGHGCGDDNIDLGCSGFDGLFDLSDPLGQRGLTGGKTGRHRGDRDA